MTLLSEPQHPGHVLQELYLGPTGISAQGLANHIGIPTQTVEQILQARAAVAVEVAQRLARAFRTTPRFWLNMQISHDLVRAARTIDLTAIEPLDYIREQGQV